MKIGVLALQGDFALHRRVLDNLGVDNIAVKKPEELRDCQGLIIPGGESTTLIKLLKPIGLFEAIPQFSRTRSIFGTCAGAILVSRQSSNHGVETFGCIDIDIERNAYGTQVDSFSDQIELNLNGETILSEGVFIRAPRIRRVGEGVSIIGSYKHEAVVVENERTVAATCHPELTDDTTLHRYFVEKVRKGIPA